MKKTILLALALFLALSPLATAQTTAAPPAADLQAALDAMVAAENAFSKMSVEKGMKDAFVTFLADDSILFRPTPVPGKQWMSSRPGPPPGGGTLIWRPAHAEIAASGDMGYSTGPFEFRSPDASRPPGHGTFFSVWQKQADGSWKVMMDVGVNHPADPSGPKLDGVATPIRVGQVAPASGKADTAAEEAALIERDRAFAQALASQGAQAAYQARLAENARLLRDGHSPYVGAEAVRSALASGTPASWEPLGGDVSAGGDFGYTYGRYPAGANEKPVPGKSGHYLRVWRKQAGDWKLLAEVLNALPPPPPPRPASGQPGR